MSFNCYFLGGVDKFVMDGHTITGLDAQGQEVFSHTYKLLDEENENGFIFYQSEDEDSGEFTYYAQAVNIPHYGWMAVLFAVLSYLIYVAALMCSHLSAFRVATNLRLAVSEHLAVLPLGFAETFGSGKLRKIIHESTGAAETYLAHQLPDQYNAIATPVGLLVLLLAFDWRLGLLSLAPVVLAFLIMATMTGKRMVEKMRQYGNALESMSNEAVEYVRGIPGGQDLRAECVFLQKIQDHH